jgi:hypothetical protein
MMQAFLVSLIAGVAFPLLPILAEYGVTHHVQLEAIALVAIVYAAAVGMSSRHQFVTMSGLFCATICAIIYGAVKLTDSAHADVPFLRYGAFISGAILFFYAACWAVERFGRHYVEQTPFLEF